VSDAPQPLDAEPEAAREPPAADHELVLVVDDDPFIGRLLEIELRAAGYDVDIAADGMQALECIGRRSPALVLADVMMPNMDGLELTRRLRADPTTSSMSVVLLTARGLSSDKLEGFSVGADDYIVKPFDTLELLARVKGVLRRAREMRAQSPLTGLPGNVWIEEEIEARLVAGRQFALLYVDMDHFTSFNDRYGFAHGDTAIRSTALMLQDVALQVGGAEAFVGHVGGDDFVVVCAPQFATPVAQAAADRFDRHVPELYDEADAARGWIEVADGRGTAQRFPLLTVSIGIATTERRRFAHYAQVVAVSTEMKNVAKDRDAQTSAWAVDGRTQ
jgi:diguanylate cyclase (GGDEF)-like protein